MHSLRMEGLDLAPEDAVDAAKYVAGTITPGQDISAAYLRDGALKYERANTGCNPFSGPIMDKALAYVAAHSGGHVDVGA